MTILPLLAVSFIMKVFAALFLTCAVVLILIILIQKGKGGGLSGALAGGAASNILGTKTGDFLTWATIVVAGVFLLISIVMAKFYKPSVSDFGGRAATEQSQPQREQPIKSELPPPVSAQTGGETADVNLPGK